MPRLMAHLFFYMHTSWHGLPVNNSSLHTFLYTCLHTCLHASACIVRMSAHRLDSLLQRVLQWDSQDKYAPMHAHARSAPNGPTPHPTTAQRTTRIACTTCPAHEMHSTQRAWRVLHACSAQHGTSIARYSTHVRAHDRCVHLSVCMSMHLSKPDLWICLHGWLCTGKC